jgi:hypothetical protein
MRPSLVLLLLAAALSLGGCRKKHGDAKPVPAASAKARPPVPSAQQLPPAKQAMGVNLLANGDAETPNDADPMPGWRRDPAVHGWAVEAYGHTSGEYEWGYSDVPGSGKNYLRVMLDGDHKVAHARQRFDVSFAAAAIDGGNVTLALSGYLGGTPKGNAAPTITARFFDASGKGIGNVALPAPDLDKLRKAEKGSVAMTKKEAQGPVPAGARQIEIDLEGSVRKDADVAIADNLSASLVAKP